VSAVEQAVYADSSERVAIASSAGVSGGYEATSCYAYLQAMAGEGESLQTGLGFGLARSPDGLDPERIGREGGERAAALVGAGRPGSRACPVLLDETVAASFVGLIGSTLCADAVQRGRSPFAGRLGEEVAAGELALADDGTDPEGLAASPFDDEGVPRRRTPLVESGRLRTYLHDSYTARRDGGASTGNASRAGYRSPPSVSTSNLVVPDGVMDFEALAGKAGDGVYVTDVVGLHSGVNPVSGTFSVGASGRVISGGALAEPISGFTIASDLRSMLLAVRAVGSAGRWVPFGGSVRTPPILIGEMTVSGE
jgi:PmbA protein